MSLGTMLQEKREQQKISRATVAKKLGYATPQFVYQVEKEKARFPLKSLKKVSQAYNVPWSKVKSAYYAESVERLNRELNSL